MTCVCMRLYETTSMIKSTSGRVHPMGMPSNLLGPQVDEFIPQGCLEIIKSTSGQVHY